MADPTKVNDLLGTAGLSGGPGIDHTRRLRCPENEHASDPNVRDHNHDVTTDLRVDVRGGSAVLVGRAECRCGWSDEVVFDDS